MATIGQVRGLSASARPFLWEFSLGEDAVPGGGGISERLTLRARNVQFPDSTIESTLSWFKGIGIKHPTRRNYSRTLIVRFEEGLDASIYNRIILWQDLIHSAKTGLGESDYTLTKTDAFLRVFDYAKNEKFSAVLREFYPENVPIVPFDYANATDLVYVDITFAYDYWELGVTS